MRTTLEIEDEVFRKAKQRAVERGRTLGELVTESLRGALAARDISPEPEFVMPVFGLSGNTIRRTAADLAAFRDEGR